MSKKECFEIHQFIDYLKKELNLDILIYDLVGFMCDASCLQKFTVHTNPYCMFVKKNYSLWDHCIKNKKNIIKKLLKDNSPFYGCCHCGVMEYIYPISHEGTLLGFVSINGFRADEKTATRRMQRISSRYDLPFKQLKKTYYDNLTDKRELSASENILIQSLCYMLKTLVFDMTIVTSAKSLSDHLIYHKQRSLIIRAQEFIHANYYKKVNLNEISSFCNCSKSHLQHQFKRYYGITISEYIQQIRLEKAKLLLKTTTLSIYEVAYQVGFTDANYFSSVFTKSFNITPSMFRNE